LAEIAQTLDSVTAQARTLEEIRKDDLRTGDLVLVSTRNSLYKIWVLNEDFYLVWGGWFERTTQSPQRVTINGCTWGGSTIKQDIVAALGLRLEFGNTVITTRIRHIRVIRAQVKMFVN
jgi:hypothetical protein